jgi:HK97 gp10 family phage protein
MTLLLIIDMAGFTAQIDTRDLNILLGRLAKLKKEFSPKELRKVFLLAAPPVVAAIKNAAPEGKTKALKKSIGVIPYLGSRTGTLFIGVRKDRVAKKITAFYGSFLEFGTKYIPKGKFSFFEKSVNGSIDSAKNRLASEFTKIINKYA